ncbi:MAG TPA: hypothetical protein DHW82_07610 [Spirochaetia bacterium]|nr:MAG: hypothetical protein A2Y41_13010 [Spirochaetes bacterium GWB1_36_13]HCL56860.1 hypothetical protein [Spirochaetia bacterium]
MFKKTLFSSFLLLVFFGCSSVNVRPLSELSDPRLIFEEGLKLVSAKEYNMAMDYFNFILTNYSQPENEKYYSWALYETGFCFYMLGDDKQALDHFNLVLGSAKTRGPRNLASLLKDKISRGNGYKNTSYN